MNTQLVEARSSPDLSLELRPATQPSSAELDDARSQAIALRIAQRDRRDRELAADRLLLQTVPRR